MELAEFNATPELSARWLSSLGEAWSRQAYNLIIFGILSAPAVIGVGGSNMRIIFPVLAFVVAATLFLMGRISQYVSFCLWLFLLTPLIRRLVDVQLGWESLNFLMLAPYAALSLSSVVIPRLFKGDPNSISPLILGVLLCSIYGLTVAFLDGRMFAGLFDFLRWTLPPCLAALIVFNPSHFRTLKVDVFVTFVFAVPLLSFYGIYQYLFVPPWDAYWMLNVDMQSIGSPDPYGVHIFSTMNSPAVFASFLVTGIVILLTTSGVLRLIGIAMGVGALALTLIRTSWLGLAICLLIIAKLGNMRLRFNLALIAIVAILATPVVLVVPQTRDLLEDRFNSLTDLNSDNSYNERMASYTQFLTNFGDNVAGHGLGFSGTYQSYADNQASNVTDSGFIDILSALGPLVGFFYFFVVLAIAGKALTAKTNAGDRVFVAGLKSVIVSSLVLLISTTTITGEMGIYFWLSVGFCLAADSFRRRAPILPRGT